MKYNFTPEGVCTRTIDFEIDNAGKLRNVRFTGGCQGNTQGVIALAEGRDAASVSACLRGINCKGRGTSCPDQLAQAIQQALENNPE